VKDRAALFIVEDAEARGAIQPGGTIVEGTAGNTGIGLALAANAKGYKTIIVMPETQSREKMDTLRALGAELVLVPAAPYSNPGHFVHTSRRIAEETPNAIWANQFDNIANRRAHIVGTAEEIWAQMDHRVDAVVCGVGSGGTITGLTHFFRSIGHPVKMILADPAGSVLAEYTRSGHIGTAGSWQVEGIGEDFVPPIADLSGVSDAYSIDDKESFAAGRELFRVEGVFGGTSSGTLLAAALRYCRSRTSPERVVTFICDTGAKYLSKMYDDSWMADQGLLERATAGDLTDLITRRFAVGGTPRRISFDRATGRAIVTNEDGWIDYLFLP